MGSPTKPRIESSGRNTEETSSDACRMFNVPMDELDWSERPIAVIHRTMKALAQTKSRPILLEDDSGDLLRFRCLLPF